MSFGNIDEIKTILENEVMHKKTLLVDDLERLEEEREETEFLNEIAEDYKKYNQIILQQKQIQVKELMKILDYIDELTETQAVTKYTLNHSKRVKKLVLVSSFCLGKEINLWVRFFSSPIFCNTIGRISLALIKAFRWLLTPFRNPLRLFNPISKIKIDMGKRITTLKGQSTVLLSQLSTLVTPTLIVWGEKDRIVPASHCYAAANVIPDCKTHVFEDCGHIVYKQRISEFSKLIDSFIGK